MRTSCAFNSDETSVLLVTGEECDALEELVSAAVKQRKERPKEEIEVGQVWSDVDNADHLVEVEFVQSGLVHTRSLGSIGEVSYMDSGYFARNFSRLPFRREP